MEWLDPTSHSGLLVLLASSFLSATLLPGNSEVVLGTMLYRDTSGWQLAVLTAALGNTLGGMSTYLLARLLPERATLHKLHWLRQHGPAVLLLSWLPVVGDGLCAAAGWLRLPWPACLVWMAAGKLFRYVIIALPFI